MEIVEAIAAAGAVDANNVPAAVGKPAKELKIDKLFVRDELSINPTDVPAPEATSPAATPSASASS